MATMADVARHAGVTKQTVSNVITGKAAVREQTRQRVLAAIEALGYRPNLIARGLSMGKTFTVAIVVPTIANPFYSEIVEEVENVVEEHAHSLVLCTTQYDLERAHRQVQILVDRCVDGMLILEDQATIAELANLAVQDIPVILGCWEYEPYPDNFPMVGIDYRHAGYLAGQHLLHLGHRDRTAIIFESPAHDLRLAGFRQALLAKGVELHSDLMKGMPDSSYESGYQAAQALLSSAVVPSAIFATTDWMALGVMDAVRDADLCIPNDISLIGFDDVIRAAYTRPPLTTIAIPKREMAKEMTELLLRCIAQEKPQPSLFTLLRPQLIVRGSTAAPRSQ